MLPQLVTFEDARARQESPRGFAPATFAVSVNCRLSDPQAGREGVHTGRSRGCWRSKGREEHIGSSV